MTACCFYLFWQNKFSLWSFHLKVFLPKRFNKVLWNLYFTGWVDETVGLCTLVVATVQVSWSSFHAQYHRGAISDLKKEFSVSSFLTLLCIREWQGRSVFCSSQVRVLSALLLVKLLLVGPVHWSHQTDGASEVFSAGLLPKYGTFAEVSEALVPLRQEALVPLRQEPLTERISEDRKYLCLWCVWRKSSVSAFYEQSDV